MKVKSERDSVMSDSLRPHGLYSPWNSPAQKILEWVVFPFSRGSSQPRDKTQVSHMVGGFFTSEPQGKSKNTGVSSLSLLQRIFLTQALNQGLLHCRQIVYQMNYQGHAAIVMSHFIDNVQKQLETKSLNLKNFLL